MHVAFVTSEMVPVREDWRARRRLGGPAEGPAEARPSGHRGPAALPADRLPPGDFAVSVHVPVDAISRSAGFYRTLRDDGVEVVFVEHLPFFDRDALYGEYTDNHLRFAFLARAASSISGAAPSGPTSSTPTTGRPASSPST